VPLTKAQAQAREAKRRGEGRDHHRAGTVLSDDHKRKLREAWTRRRAREQEVKDEDGLES
jgi:hypothetical protein